MQSNGIIQSIMQNGWKQGSIIQGELKDGEIKKNGHGLFMLLSQDCDICHGKLEDEPNVEIVGFKIVEGDSDGSLTHGKNPRRLQLELNDDNYYEFHAKDRRFIEKKLLADLHPHQSLQTPPNSLRLIIKWVTKRYDRDAFPFKFDERFKRKNRDKLKKTLQKYVKEITGIFIRLNTIEELPSDKPYLVDLVLLIYPEYKENKEISQVLEKIYECLNNNDGIDVVSGYRVITTEEISVAEISELSELDYDYMSFRNPESTD